MIDIDSNNNDQYALRMYKMPGIVLRALQISSGFVSQESYTVSSIVIMPILQVNSQG